MIRSVKAHPGVFIGGMVTYAVVVHWVLPMYRGRGAKGAPSA